MTSPKIDSDRLSFLFDLACGASDAPQGELPEEEQQELERMRVLLDSIDAAWHVSQARLDHIHTLFLRKLATEFPDHPWVRMSTVHTLGQLLHLSHDDAPALPPDTFEQLLTDATPVETLLDPSERKPAIREAVRRAHVPQSTIGELLLWINRAVVQLVPQPNAGAKHLLFMRRQGDTDRPSQAKDRHHG
jgi:hypothetical protein